MDKSKSDAITKAAKVAYADADYLGTIKPKFLSNEILMASHGPGNLGDQV